MKHIPYALLPLLLLMIACTGGRQHAAMQQALAELERCNQADSLLTDDSLAIALTQYFDRRGTANERMHAHYLLGRTYADRGEAPQAIAAYQTAAEQADTTAPDCDYRLLCRVYSQMGYLLYQQNLEDQYLCVIENSIRFAQMAGDTLAELNLYGQKMNAYERVGSYDSVISVYENVRKRGHLLGMDSTVARFSASPIMSYLARKDYVKAKACIDLYEKMSSYFDEAGNIDRGRELYYYFKGQYYLFTHQFDSAEHYFRKELLYGKDYFNQNTASKGLALLFTMTHLSDSAAKYALYSYDMNDSVYAQMATEEVARVQRLYNYNNQQKEALLQKERAYKEKQRADALFVTILLLIIIACVFFYRWRLKRKAERIVYQQNLEKLEQAQSDILQLRSHEKENSKLIQEKEAIVEKQRIELDAYRCKERQQKEDAENRLLSSDVYKALHKKADMGLLLEDEVWHEVHRITIDLLPAFYQFISSNKFRLNENEYRICVLLRLHVSATSIGHLIGVSEPYVSQASRKMNDRLFGNAGSSRKLAEELSKYS